MSNRRISSAGCARAQLINRYGIGRFPTAPFNLGKLHGPPVAFPVPDCPFVTRSIA